MQGAEHVLLQTMGFMGTCGMHECFGHPAGRNMPNAPMTAVHLYVQTPALPSSDDRCPLRCLLQCPCRRRHSSRSMAGW